MSRSWRTALLPLVAAVFAAVPAASASAADILAFERSAAASADRFHDLGGREHIMAFSPRFEPEPALPSRLTLALERRAGVTGTVKVEIGYWGPEDQEYWLADNGARAVADIPASAIPVRPGAGYGGGTVDVPLRANWQTGDGGILTIIVRAPGAAGDFVLGSADLLDDGWNRAKSRRVGGTWADTDAFGMRLFVDPDRQPDEVPPDEEPEPWGFTGFGWPVGAGVTPWSAGVPVPLSFGLGGDRGLEILDGAPVVRRVACGTAPVTPAEQPAVAAVPLWYSAARDRYLYLWRTSRAWAGTCRSIEVRLADGSSHSATFRFGGQGDDSDSD